jgi:hypothetical protein
VDLSLPMINPCTGESIVLAGSTHFIFTITVDQGGGEHFVSQSNTQRDGDQRERREVRPRNGGHVRRDARQRARP